MNRAELTESQLTGIKLVMRKLGGAGWDLEGWMSSFESIDQVWPEVEAFYDNTMASLCVTYSFTSDYIAVLVGTKDHSQYIEFRVYLGNKLEEALDLIIDYQDTVSFDDYHALLRSMKDLCGAAFWEQQGFEGPPVTDDELVRSEEDDVSGEL
jgi:hypothetical protein